MIAVDSSVVIAAFSPQSTGYVASQKALRRKPRLPAHSVLEAYSTLTKMPPPFRASPHSVLEYLRALLSEPVLTLAAADLPRLVEQAVEGGVIGGAIYDALIAATAKRAGATLLTRDRRALRTYQAVGAEAELVE